MNEADLRLDCQMHLRGPDGKEEHVASALPCERNAAKEPVQFSNQSRPVAPAQAVIARNLLDRKIECRDDQADAVEP